MGADDDTREQRRIEAQLPPPLDYSGSMVSAMCAPGSWHLGARRVEAGRAFTEEQFPGWSDRDAFARSRESGTDATVRFLEARFPTWREPQPGDLVSSQSCVVGEVVSAWTPPPVPWWRRSLSGVWRRLSRHSGREVSAFDSGMFEEDPDAGGEEWW